MIFYNEPSYLSGIIVIIYLTLAVSVMKSLIHNIGMESVILWNAILLEKRVLVYGESIDNVMQVTTVTFTLVICFMHQGPSIISLQEKTFKILLL